jgi:hypothetical protein
VSGIYMVVDVYGAPQKRQATVQAGEAFPPTRPATDEYGFVLLNAADPAGAHER